MTEDKNFENAERVVIVNELLAQMKGRGESVRPSMMTAIEQFKAGLIDDDALLMVALCTGKDEEVGYCHPASTARN